MSDQKNDRPLYNSRIVDNYIKLIKNHYNYINIHELLEYADIETYQIEDEGHWFTQNQINRFHEKLREATGKKDIAREAGRYAASPDALGMMRRYILGLIGPVNAYELVGKYASRFTKSSKFEVNRIDEDKVEIRVTQNDGVKEESFQCENRLGYWEAISKIFNYKIKEIEHSQCMFKGDESCVYVLNLPKSDALIWKNSRDYAAIFFGVILCVMPFVFSFHALAIALPIFLSIILVFSFRWKSLEVDELKKAVENLSWSSEKLIEQVNLNYENSLMINEIGQALSKESDLDGILSKVLNVLEKRLDYDRGLILLANKSNTRLISKAGYGYELDELSKFMMSSGFHLDKKKSRGIFINCFKKQQPFLINNIDEIKEDLSSRSLEFARKMGVKSFICCPIIYEGESLGILAVDNLKTKKPLVQSDINILMGIAPQIGVGIHNIKLVEVRFRQFQSILQALVASTEARDPITAGHSAKVTDYAVGICKELGLPHEYTDMIRVASSLHDYGKIGVDDSILKKPARLDPEEYEHIKTHVDKTRSILEQIHFEGVFKEVPRIAASHHEKVDGTGYPKGLIGEDIPFGGKIIAVADVFEALTSRRHYREPLPVNEALDHLVENIGTHFDNSCVGAFINYYNENETTIPYIPRGSFKSLGKNKTN